MASTPTQALLPGTKLDSFRVESVLGVGGFGITYAAFDETLQCPVAIKEYFPSDLARRTESRTTVVPTSGEGQQSYDYGLRRFLQEARTLAQFHEPNIVRVRGFIEANGTAYLVMDHEQGRSLGRILSEDKRISSGQAKRIALDCLRGLRAMHAQNYLHRDIKPDNIFLRKNGSAVLLDFGAARMALKNQKSHMTIILTPGYAPIEQYSAGEQQGPWTDLYAVGATLYHCIVGQAPPASTERISSVSRGKTDAAAEWLDAVEKRADEALLSAVRWMIQPHSENRPKYADEVISLLQGTAEDQRTLFLDERQDKGNNVQSPTIAQTGASQPTFASPSSSADERPVPGGSGPGGTHGESVEPARVESATNALAAILGPIAGVIVQRAAREAKSLEEFYRLVANELDDETERKRFLNSLKF